MRGVSNWMILSSNSRNRYVNVLYSNSLRSKQNGCNFANDIFKHIFMTENVLTLIVISLKFVRQGPISNKPALAQIKTWYRKGDTPLSKSMVAYFTDAYIRCTASIG